MTQGATTPLEQSVEYIEFTAEQDILATHILIKVAKHGTDTGARIANIRRFIAELPDYQRLSICQWIKSYAPDNKFWEEIYGYALVSLIRDYQKNSSTPGIVKKIRKSKKPKIDYQRAKQELQCVELAQEHGIILKQRGALMVGICPFHSEKTPSFTIYPENNFYCYGCHKGGDSISLLKLLKNI